MDHAEIEAKGLVELYFQGRVPPEDEARFEEHFVACPQCQHELELARGLARGLKAMAVEDAARLGVFAWLAQRGRRVQAAVAALVLVAAALPLAWTAWQGRRASEPLADMPVFLLGAARGEPGEAATVDLGRAGEALALAVDPGFDPRVVAYRAVLVDARGEVRFERGELLPNSLEVLMLTFPASFFTPGEYRLRVEGELAGGGTVEVGAYTFRVVAAP